MEYVVYILYSQKTDRYYVGQTQNLGKRLERHNSGRNKSKKPGIPWLIVHFEALSDILLDGFSFEITTIIGMVLLSWTNAEDS